jgi:hypothetical protein
MKTLFATLLFSFSPLILFALTVPELQEQIDRSEYKPRTCVASLFVNEQINDFIQRSANKSIKNYGYGSLTEYNALYDFKLGPKGLIECLEGDYEDVTLISHSRKYLGTSLVYERKGSDGSTKFSFLSPRVFSGFSKGKRKPGSRLRQITVIACDSEEVVRTDPHLQRFVKKYGILLRHQPTNFMPFNFSSSKAPRALGLVGVMIAESAQPEEIDRVFCMLSSKMIIVGESGKTICLRNRYSAQLRGLHLGFKKSNQIFYFRPKKVDESENGISVFSLFDLELSLGLTLSVHPTLNKSFAHRTQSYGLGVGLFESIRVKKMLSAEH